MTWFLSLSVSGRQGKNHSVFLYRSEINQHILNNFDCHAAIYSDKLRQRCVKFLMHVQMQITDSTFFVFNIGAVFSSSGKHTHTHKPVESSEFIHYHLSTWQSGVKLD